MSTLSAAARAAAHAAVLALVDSGSGAGVLALLDGASVLVPFTLADPAFDADGEALSLPRSGTSAGAGEVDGFELRTSAGTVVLSGTAGEASSEITLQNANLKTGQLASLSALVVSYGDVDEPWDPGEVGVWTDVTPGGLDLVSDFGVQDVWADPVTPGTFYAFVCFDDVYKSTDWGGTWAPISDDIDGGRPWGECVAPDGSYMLAAVSVINGGAWRSTDDGVTWASHTMGGSDDPYNFDIDPSDPLHVIGTMHAGDDVYESTDGGLTWTNRGSSGSGDSGYVFFITSTTWIAVAQDGGSAGTRRTTNSGTSWAQVGPMQHAHGNCQIFIDTNGDIYVGHHEAGVYRSTDGGASFTQVSTTLATCVIATENYFYATDPGASGAGTPPRFQRAPRSDGTDWEDVSTPTEMSNGLKRAAVFTHPSGRSGIVGGCWNAGIWRYLEA